MIGVSLMGMGSAEAKVVGQAVEYQAGDTVMRGYLAYDDAAKLPHPGILVVHEWWGVDDYVRGRARQLAELGYTALALDMYGEGRTAQDPQTAGKMSSEISKDIPVAKQRFEAALSFLRKQKHVAPHQIAAIGYCFGGAVVLNMARSGEDLVGVVSFHGNLAASTPAKPGDVHARILVCHGADDPFVPAAQVEAFRKEMAAAGAKSEIVIYPGAKHSFTNPASTERGQKFKLPIAYNQAADKQSWADMRAFFKSLFGK
jgi:dienelactone hydrolase